MKPHDTDDSGDSKLNRIKEIAYFIMCDSPFGLPLIPLSIAMAASYTFTGKYLMIKVMLILILVALTLSFSIPLIKEAINAIKNDKEAKE